MPPEAVLATLRAVWSTLQAMKIPAALMGGLALSAWKHPRFTADVDLVIGVGETMSNQVIKGLAATGIRTKSGGSVLKIDDARFIQLLFTPPGLLLDIQIDLHLSTTEFHRQAIERRVPLPAAELGFEVSVVSCEDLILFKLKAGRILDRVDVGELLKANRNSLDFEYIGHWSKRLEITKSFQEAWRDVFGQESLPFSA